MTPNPDGSVQQRPWFSRNWKWLVPVGCLVPFLCCGSFAGVTFLGVGTMIKSSEAYKEAVTRSEADPEVQASLGTPLTGGLLVTGSLKDENGNGTADFNVGVSGPKGKGTLHVVGTSTNGRWQLFTIDVDTDSKTIHVIKEQDAPPLPDDDEDPVEPEPD